MDLEKVYHDFNGNPCSITEMVKNEPDWAANRIQAGENAAMPQSNASRF
ncbi:hypothetical protein [Desulfosarcina widdelii]|nr:hypothetical protein [Desulfosarcina widdelii]